MKQLALLLALFAAGPGVARAATPPSGTAVSTNWSGYAVSAARSSFTDVKGSWVAPAVNCATGQGYSSFWVGLGGSSDGAQGLEQIGTSSDCGGRGHATYYAWYELIPSPPVTIRLAVSPGDAFSAEVSLDGSTVTLSITNVTKGTSYTTSATISNPDDTSAEWVAEAPSAQGAFGGFRPLPLANFGTVTFTGASATTSDGHTGTISDGAWTAQPIALSSFFRGLSAVPSELTADGSGFSVTWRSSGFRSYFPRPSRGSPLPI